MANKTQDAKTSKRPTQVKTPSKSAKTLMTAKRKKASKVQMQDFHFTRQRGQKT